ncbi:MAG: hypothetical protein AAGI46_04920 [Planctomycetota bacterium]
MAGETLMHKTLKKEACRWMFRQGYRSVAAEVRINPLGIIDAVGAGVFRAYHNYLSVPYALPQSIFIECKASRGDFLRDCCRDPKQLKLALKAKREDWLQRGLVRRHRKIRGQAGLGKFKSCLLTPMAHLHYVMAPAGLLKKADLPPRWGLLTLGDGGVSVTVRADWVEMANAANVEACIARTLTGDIHRADDRAIGSVNRELFAQQQQLADRIRALGPVLVEQQRAATTIDRPATLFADPDPKPEPVTAGDAMRPSVKRKPSGRRRVVA